MHRLAGVIFLFILGSFASCSDGSEDVLIRACKVVVDNCKRGSSVGECVDDLGPLASDCTGCISQHPCDFAVCQATVPGCRLPEYMLDPKDRIDPGPRPPDAGSADGSPIESGSSG